MKTIVLLCNLNRFKTPANSSGQISLLRLNILMTMTSGISKNVKDLLIIIYKIYKTTRLLKISQI